MEVKSNLDDLRDLVERFMEEMALARYRAGAGLGEAGAVDSVIRRHNSLMDPAILEMVAEESGTEEAGVSDELRRALLFLHLDEEARPSTERLMAEMRKARLRVSGEDIPFLDSSRRIDAEGDRRKRALIALARANKVAEWEPILQHRLARLDEKSREMGRKGYGALLETESGFDLAALEGQIGEFLARTQDLYREVFSWLMKSRLGMDPADAEHHDLRRAFRGEEFDSLLSEGQLLTALSNFTRAIQIDLQAAGRIEFDLEDRPGKQSRPFFSRVRVPDQIILTAAPRRGHAHIRAWLHELGHSLHYAYTSERVGFEGRLLGDNSVTEAFGFLMERLALEPRWLKRFAGMDEPVPFVQFASAHRLYRLRRAAAQYQFELRLYREGVSTSLADEYRVRLSEACLCMVPRAFYLFNISPHLYSARHLRGWILEAMLHRHLVHYFEEDWFRNPRAGQFLIRLWAEGQEGGADRIASQIGAESLDLQPLIEDFEKKF